MKNKITYTETFIGMLLVEIVEYHRNSVEYNYNKQIVNRYKEKRKKEVTVVVLSFELKDQEENQLLVLKFDTQELSPSICLEIAKEISKNCKNLEIKIKTA